MEWVRLSHESVTGRDGYSDFYKKDITFNVLEAVGDKVEEWTLKGSYIQNLNFNDLDWKTVKQTRDITLTIQYDYNITILIKRRSNYEFFERNVFQVIKVSSRFVGFLLVYVDL